jgi:hypothetical protein
MKRLAVLAVPLACPPAFADSFNVFLLDRIVDHQEVLVQLTPNGNPLVHNSDPAGSSFTFEIENVFSSTFDIQGSVTLTLAGQTITDTTLDGFICPDPQPCSFGVSFGTPFFSKPVQGAIVLTIDGQTEKFNFRFTSMPALSQAPEPTTLLLLGTGLAGMDGASTKGIRRLKGYSNGDSCGEPPSSGPAQRG